MLVNRHIVLFTISAAVPISSTKLLPRGHHAGIELPAALEIYEVTVNISDRPDAVPLPRLRFPAIEAQAYLSAPKSSPAHVKRTLLGTRQTCNAGYGYCEGKYSVIFHTDVHQNFPLICFLSIREMLPRHREWQMLR